MDFDKVCVCEAVATDSVLGSGLEPPSILFIDSCISVSCVNNLIGFNNNHPLSFWFKF